MKKRLKHWLQKARNKAPGTQARPRLPAGLQLKRFTHRGNPALDQNGVEDCWLKIVSYQSRAGQQMAVDRSLAGRPSPGWNRSRKWLHAEVTPEFFKDNMNVSSIRFLRKSV